MHAAHNRLLPLTKIFFDVDHLVFYEENQPSYLGLATRTPDQFRSATAKLGLDLEDWDYCTLHTRPRN